MKFTSKNKKNILTILSNGGMMTVSSRKRGDAKKALRQTQDLNSKKIFPNILFEIFVQIQEVEPIRII